MESIDQAWILAGIALAIGLVLGALLHKLLSSSGEDIDQLKTELEQARSEMERYKASVNTHFNKTSDLVKDLTQDYVKVYQHLAEGAQSLSDSPEFKQVLEQPRGKVLISMEEDSQEPETSDVVTDPGNDAPVADAAADPVAEADAQVDQPPLADAVGEPVADEDPGRKDAAAGEAAMEADDSPTETSTAKPEDAQTAKDSADDSAVSEAAANEFPDKEPADKELADKELADKELADKNPAETDTVKKT